MTITSFNPMIITGNAQPVVALFEALGFERRHFKTGIKADESNNLRMRYTGEDGKVFHVDVAEAPVSQDILAIRLNVRDFDEAYRFLEERGFKNMDGDKITDTGSSKATSMIAPSGFVIVLDQHIRKDD